MRISPILTNFTAGEWSPEMAGRVDLSKYANACRTLENYFIRVHGGAQRRPGTYFVSEVKDSSKNTRLIPFEFSVSQAYVLEFGDGYIRFFKDRGQILDSGVPYEIVSPYGEGDLAELKFVQDADTMYIVHPDYAPYKLTRTGHTSWTITKVTFIDGPYRDLNSSTETTGTQLCPDGDMELNSGWSSVGTPTTQERSSDGSVSGSYCRKFVVDAAGEGIKGGTFTTTTDKIYRATFWVYCATGSIRVAVRKGDNSGYAVEHTVNGVPYQEWAQFKVAWKETAGGAGAYIKFTNATGTTGTYYVDLVEIYEVTTILLTPSATTGSITLTASEAFFNANHVGAFIRVFHDGKWGYVLIEAYTSSTQVTATVMSELGGTIATEDWREGAWSDYRGWPAAVWFSDQRLVFGGTATDPQTEWASRVADYENFTPGVNDDDPYTYKMASERVNVIRWISSLSQMIVGTVGGCWRLGGSDTDATVTPSNARFSKKTRYGVADIQPLDMGSSLLFMERNGHPDNAGIRVRDLSYQMESDSYVGKDLTLVANHIAKPGIWEWDFQAAPYSILWAVRADGVLIGLTYDPSQEVIGWHRHITDGLVDSLCVIPGTNQDEVWMIAKREIGGVTKRYIEYMTDFDFGTDQRYCHFVDSGLMYDGDEVAITGATEANPVVVTAPAHGLSNGDIVWIDNVEGMTEINGRYYAIANKTTNTFELTHHVTGENIDGTGYTTYESGGIAKKTATTASGLDHLEGKAVSILADGAVHPDCTVTGGEITLERPAGVIIAGLPYASTLVTMPLETQTREGTGQGKVKRIHGLTVRFHNSLGGKVGSSLDDLEELTFRTTVDLMGRPPALRSADKDIGAFPHDSGYEAVVVVVQDQPLPQTVLAVMPRYATEDR
jgi:hypothetical protein